MPQPVIYREHFKLEVEIPRPGLLRTVFRWLTRRKAHVLLRFYGDYLPCPHCQTRLFFYLENEFGEKSVEDTLIDPEDLWDLAITAPHDQTMEQIMHFLDHTVGSRIEECVRRPKQECSRERSEQPITV